MIDIKEATVRAVYVLSIAGILIGTLAGSPGSTTQGTSVAPLQWLIGGAWIAETSKRDPRSRIETRYRLAATGNFIQFTTAFLDANGKPYRHYAGNIFLDPATKHFAMWYMDSDNSIVQGPVEAADGHLSMLFDERSAAGNSTSYRVEVSRVSINTYSWNLFSRSSEPSTVWTRLLSLVFVRQNNGLDSFSKPD